jgi:Holliday junction resolvase RusA-like endonuclease
MITFFVSGIPAPQGSKTGRVVNGKVVMWESSTKVKPWREAVKRTAEVAMREKYLVTGPVEVCLSFQMPKPKTLKRLFPSVKPDLDKLIRSTLDGLSKTCYQDDALVIGISAVKVYSNDPGCWITIVEQDEDA